MALGGFFCLSSELKEAQRGDVESITTVDQITSKKVIENRNQNFDHMAVDITALGSTTVLIFLTGILCLYFFCNRNYPAFFYLIIVGCGAAIFTYALKSYFKIPRPDEMHFLVQANGYSFPSGHTLSATSIYLAVAIIAIKSLKNSCQKILMVGAFSCLILLVGFSRIYLGVHYLSDVLGGILFGSAWAIAVAQARRLLL